LAPRLLRVALTGGIATGKSHCAARLAALGAPVIDADILARDAVAPGTPGLAAVAARFGDPVLAADGSLNRSSLASIVFADPAARADLEAIVHPVVYDRIRRWFEDLEGHESGPPAAFACIPLLYETRREDDFDRVVVAACPRPQQIERLMARDGLSLNDARARLASQWPIEEKARRADYVIDTSGTFEETNRQVDDLWRQVGRRNDVGRN
jgi:dephospho-CoA kinase